MQQLLNYIVWQPDLEAFHLGPDNGALVWSDVDYWPYAGLFRCEAAL